MVNTITALYDVGAIGGVNAAAFTTEPLGRKRTLIIGAMILHIGTILMGSCVGRIQMIIARILARIGVASYLRVSPAATNASDTLPPVRLQLPVNVGETSLIPWQ